MLDEIFHNLHNGLDFPSEENIKIPDTVFLEDRVRMSGKRVLKLIPSSSM
jgi:hypothetical protein